MRAGWAYFVSFPQAAKDFAELSKTKLTMPVLVIGGEKANGTLLGQQMKIVAADATRVVLKDTGHWVLEERPKQTTDALGEISVRECRLGSVSDGGALDLSTVKGAGKPAADPGPTRVEGLIEDDHGSAVAFAAAVVQPPQRADCLKS